MSDTTSRCMPAKKTDVQIFTVGEIADAMDSSKKNLSFKIPKFQRGIVWNQSKRKKLIDSIKNGYPVGSILLFKEKEDTYRLIDGLQRCSSLFRYVKKPIQHIDNDAIKDLVEFKSLRSKLEGLANRTDGKCRDMILAWIDEIKDLTFDSMTSTSLQKHLHNSGLFEPTDMLEIGDMLDEFCKGIKKEYAIETYPVPAVIYMGDNSNLSDIFERINVQGTRLSTLQILAAQWNESDVVFDPNDPIEGRIQEANLRRFKSLSEEGYEITKDTDEDSLDLYEYLFGLGKVLSVEGKGVLKPTEVTDPDTIGFYLCGIWNMVPPGKLSSLQNKIGKDSMRAFSEACLEATRTVDSWFKSTYTLKLNSSKDSVSYPHSENQIISIIGRVMLEMYDPLSGEKRDSWKENKEEMRKACLAYYLMDNINDYWKGSGDSKMFGRSWAEGENGQRVLSETYRNLPNIVNVHGELSSWYNHQYDSQQKSRVTYTTAQKLFLKYIYRAIVNHDANLDDTFHLEHINSIKYMKDKIQEEGSDGWAMSIISNLMLLPENINKAKGKSSLKEHWGSLSAEDKDRVSSYLISPVEDILDRESLDETSYVGYHHRRWKAHILPEILKRLGYDSEQIKGALKR